MVSSDVSHVAGTEPRSKGRGFPQPPIREPLVVDFRSSRVGVRCQGIAAPFELPVRLERLAWPAPAPSSQASAHSYASIAQKRPRKLHFLAYLGKLASGDLWRRLCLQHMRTKCPLAGTLISQSVKTFHQLTKQVPLFPHVFLLADRHSYCFMSWVLTISHECVQIPVRSFASAALRAKS